MQQRENLFVLTRFYDIENERVFVKFPRKIIKIFSETDNFSVMTNGSPECLVRRRQKRPVAYVNLCHFAILDWNLGNFKHPYRQK